MTSRNIMIVEDDYLLATDIKNNLERSGWHIAGIAKDYVSAIQLMKKKDVNLAVIDIKLDGPEDGIVTAAELLKMKWIPIIYVTGNKPFEVKQRMKETYPYSFLEKPFRMHELSAQIELALNNFEEGLIGNPNRKQNAEYIAIPTTEGLLNVKTEEIIYVKSIYKTKNTTLFLTERELKRHGLIPSACIIAGVSFGKLTSQLPGSFFKLRRTKTINLNHVQRIKDGHVYMTSHILPIPENGRKTLLDRLNVVER